MRQGSVLLVAGLLAASPALAQRTVHAPLAAQLPLGARGLAMGGPNVGSRDAESALGNPALAGTGSLTGFSLARYHEGARGGVVGATTPVGVMGVGVAVSYLDYDTGRFGITDNVLVHGGSGAGSSIAAAFSLSAVYKGWRWGAATTYQEERVNVSRSSVAALSVGAAKDGFWRNSTLGIALQNVGPSLEMAGATTDLPLRLNAGVSGVFVPLGAWFDLGALANVAVRRDGFVSGAVGGELTYTPIEGIAFALRTGVRRAELVVQRPITAGVGFSVDRFALDYAWEQMDGGGAHRIGLRVR